MLQKLLTGLSISLVCVSAANAFNQIDLPNGKGSLSQNGAAQISLSSLNNQFVYNFACSVSTPNSDKTPTIFRVDISGITLGLNTAVNFDGNVLATQQAQINDTQAHTITINGVRFDPNPMMGGNATLTITRLDGAENNALVYDCSASYAVGK